MSLIQRVFFLLTRIMVMVAIICAFGLASTLAVAGIKKNAKLDHHIPDVVKANAKDNAVYVTRLKLSAIAGHGSGCLISSSGLVLTNWHVVLPLLANNSYNMKVDWLPWAPLLGNSTATIIYVAPEIDLALIKLDKLPGKEGAKFADQVSPTDRIY
ncbi:MAG: serine protease, partial [bacterium]